MELVPSNVLLGMSRRFRVESRIRISDGVGTGSLRWVTSGFEFVRRGSKETSVATRSPSGMPPRCYGMRAASTLYPPIWSADLRWGVVAMAAQIWTIWASWFDEPDLAALEHPLPAVPVRPPRAGQQPRVLYDRQSSHVLTLGMKKC